jgi:CRP-like cAMP-binding protein
MSVEKGIRALKDHPFVEGLSPEHMDKLASLAKQVTFERDEILFREGDESHTFYLIFYGKVGLEVVAPGKLIRVMTLVEGEELGWSAVLPSESKHFQARALSNVRALVFDGTALRVEFEKDCSLGYSITRRLLEVVAGRLQATRMQLLDLYAPAVGVRGEKL